MKNAFLRFNLFIGLGILAFSYALLAAGTPFMKTWFFCFAWWSFILILDSLNFRRSGTSPLAGPLESFMVMVFLSVAGWLLFELFNLRLRNWSYHGLPANLAERWLGYFTAYASVIPALQEMSLFIQNCFKRELIVPFHFRVQSVWLRCGILLGAAFVLMVLLWPGIFFPLTWICLIFVFEPLNFMRGNRSFLRELELEHYTRLVSWLTAGLGAGILWEFWNFWAGSHWEYHLPYLGFWRIFQMPLFGYGGFIFFSVEIFAFYEFFHAVYKRIKTRPAYKGLAVAGMCLFYLLGFYLVDSCTNVF